MGNDVKKAAAAMKARSGEAMTGVLSAVAKGPRQSRILSEWLANKAALEREARLPQQNLSSPNYFELNFDATLVVFSFFEPQVLCRMASVSKATRALAESNDYWLPWFRVHKGITIVPRALVSSPDIYWKAVYEKASAKFPNVKEGVAACVSGDALLLPALTFYEQLDLNKENIQIMGVPDSDGALPVIEYTTNHAAVVSKTGCCLQNVEIRQPSGENVTGIHVWSSIAFQLIGCILSSQAHSCMCIGSESSVTGLVTMSSCEIRNYKQYPTERSDAGSIQVNNCRFHDGPNGLLFNTNTNAMVRDSEFYRNESCAVFGMFANGVLELVGCRFRDVGGGVWASNGAKATCTKCDFQTFKWGALEVHDGSEMTLTDCLIHDSEHESSNGVYAIDSQIKVTNCEIRDLQRAGVQTIRSRVDIQRCRFERLNSGISVYSKSKLQLFGSEFDRNASALRVGADTEFSMRDCAVQRSTECAAHITRLAVDGQANDSDEICARLERENRFSLNAGGQNVVVQWMVLTASDLEGVSPEAYLAAQQRICTFKFTGSNYHPQRVFRCLTCKLTEARGMCIVCKDICHAGHEIEIDPEIKPFFCDCGAEKFCDVLLKSSRGGALSSSDANL